jgi:hypothetical protein
MNAPKTIVLLVAGLLATVPLAAHAPKTPGLHVPQHEHPQFSKVTTRFELNDGTVVEWEASPGATNTYEVTVTQVLTGKLKIYSLLTLGLQNVRYPNEVTWIDGKDVMLYTHGSATGTPWGAKQTVPKTGLGASGQLDPDQIKFVSFSSRSSKFQVQATRPPRPGNTVWDDGSFGVLIGHDNTPPDGYPPN